MNLSLWREIPSWCNLSYAKILLSTLFKFQSRKKLQVKKEKKTFKIQFEKWKGKSLGLFLAMTHRSPRRIPRKINIVWLRYLITDNSFVGYLRSFSIRNSQSYLLASKLKKNCNILIRKWRFRKFHQKMTIHKIDYVFFYAAPQI